MKLSKWIIALTSSFIVVLASSVKLSTEDYAHLISDAFKFYNASSVTFIHLNGQQSKFLKFFINNLIYNYAEIKNLYKF